MLSEITAKSLLHQVTKTNLQRKLMNFTKYLRYYSINACSIGVFKPTKLVPKLLLNLKVSIL